MRNKQLIANIQNPIQIGESEIGDIRINLQAFPYFSTMQLLYAKGLYNIDSVSYNKQLRKAAAYSGDRKLLFKLITGNPKRITSVTEKKLDNKIEKNKPKEKTNAAKKLAIGKPLEFSENETHSFSEWLSLTKIKKIDRSNSENQGNLINTFIENTPSISQPKKEKFFSPIESAKASLLENDDIVTETLARVYLEQEYYDKAIASYEKLRLKFPQKSAFFANQIKLIYDLKEK